MSMGLNGLEPARVVQKANIGHTYTYVLQMYKNNTYVSRAKNVCNDLGTVSTRDSVKL